MYSRTISTQKCVHHNFDDVKSRFIVEIFINHFALSAIVYSFIHIR